MYHVSYIGLMTPIKRLKTDKSALIAEAIQLLYKRDSNMTFHIKNVLLLSIFLKAD